MNNYPPKPGTKITGKTNYGKTFGDSGVVLGYKHFSRGSPVSVMVV